MTLGRTIAALRKKLGFTQEQLGEALGVSGQAVSKWENGGTPDAEMLPMIADRLGVSIDTLFGLEYRHTTDIVELLKRYLTGFPDEKRLDALFRLLCPIFRLISGMFPDEELQQKSEFDLLPLKTAYAVVSHSTGEIGWRRSQVVSDEGMMLGLLAEDCPMFLLMPEPRNGYTSNLLTSEDYRSIFTALAMPGAMEILLCLYAKEERYASAEAISRVAGVKLADTRNALEALAACRLLKYTTVELMEAPTTVYATNGNYALIPLLTLARWIREGANGCFFLQHETRDGPILKEAKPKKA